MNKRLNIIGVYMNYDHVLGLLNGIDCQKPQFRIKYNSVEFPSNVIILNLLLKQ